MSKPHNQILYARNSAIADDSMTFVRLRLNPMKVRKTNAVKAEPSSVAESGDAAAAGYDY